MFPTNGKCKNGHRLTPSNIYISPKSGNRACRTCKKNRKDEWRKTPEGKELRRKHRIKCCHGLSDEDIQKMLKDQNNLCAMCGKLFTDRLPGRKGNGTSWVVDHDHETSLNRGLIHQNCNLAIGLLGDDPEKCKLAALYLEKHNASRKQGTVSVVAH